jgi:hypothetical protein
MRAALYIISTTVQRRGIADLHLLCMYSIPNANYLPTYHATRHVLESARAGAHGAACAVPVPGTGPCSRECGTGGGGAMLPRLSDEVAVL